MSKAFDPVITPEAESTDVCHPLFLTAPSSVTFKKVRKRLLRQMQAAMDDFGMVKEGQKWLVCLSGGKDSYTLLSLLLDLKSRGVLPVELLACNLDQAQPGFPQHILPAFFEKYNIPNRIVREDTYSIVKKRCRKTRPTVRYVHGFDAATSTVSHAKKGARQSFLVITVMIFWRRSSSISSMAGAWPPCRPSS